MKERAAALRAVRAARGLAQGVRLLGLELCLRADDDGSGVDTVRSIAADLEVTERCIERWLGQLSEARLFERLDRGSWRVMTPTPTVRSGRPRPYDREDPDPSVGVRPTGPDPSVGVRAPRAPGLREQDPSETSSSSKTSEDLDLCSVGGARADGPAKQKPKTKSGNAKSSWRRFPPDWQPGLEEAQLARQLNVDLAGELAKIRDYEFARPHSDPGATFRTWLRKAAERSPFQSSQRRAPNRAQEQMDRQLQRVRELEAEEAAERRAIEAEGAGAA